jgi:hypothetical protein
MKRREQTKKLGLPLTGLLGGLALVISFVVVSDDTAEARKKRPPGPEKGTCSCECGSNQKDAQGNPKWVGEGLIDANITSAACHRNLSKSCVVMSPFGLKSGEYVGCMWKNNDTSRNDVTKPGERPEENEQQPTPKQPKQAPFEKPSGGRTGN